eukprot:1212173-Prymnesium_polylepis.1
MTLALTSIGNGSVGSYSPVPQLPNLPNSVPQIPNLLNSVVTPLVTPLVECSDGHLRRLPASSSATGERGSPPGRSVGELRSLL